jgi:hypothetical protein
MAEVNILLIVLVAGIGGLLSEIFRSKGVIVFPDVDLVEKDGMQHLIIRWGSLVGFINGMVVGITLIISGFLASPNSVDYYAVFLAGIGGKEIIIGILGILPPVQDSMKAKAK